jgi:predicted RNA-binding Zn ribbon-like protein
MMKAKQATKSAVKLLGGDWSLDFANAWWNWAVDYTQLLEWSRQAGLVSEEQAQAMRRKAESSPEEALATFERAQRVRTVIHNIFWAIAHGKAVEISDLASLNRQLSLVMGKLCIRQEGGAFQWSWDTQDEELDRMLWPVVRAAAELLQSPNLRWLKACAGERCDQLFLDVSRNHSRRWCEMQHCGMLVKSRRHYAKKRQRRVLASS